VCLKRPAYTDAGLEVCTVCLGYDKPEEEEPVKNPLEELRAQNVVIEEGTLCQCEHCGDGFGAYKNGGVLIFRTCRKCLDGRLKAGRKEQSDRVGRRLLVDFNGTVDQKILELVEESASKNRRTPEAEILCLLEGWFVLKGAFPVHKSEWEKTA
jgi:hypothetical protein